MERSRAAVVACNAQALVAAVGLEQQHLEAAVFAQAVRDRATRRAGADGDGKTVEFAPA
jgi:hypothetical protein